MLKKKLKLFRNKRGVNDISIASGIITVFILLGVFLPFINSSLSVQSPSVNTTSIQTNVGQDVANIDGSFTTVSGLKIIVSVLKMFFWTFGDLPFWLDAIFVILRIILVLILIKYIPFIGS